MSDADRINEENLAEQHKRLASLESCEERIRDLRDRECDREVEHMAAEAALQGAANRLKPSIDREAAARIGQLLDNRRALEDRLRAVGGGRGGGRAGTTRTLDQLRAGHAALLAWLDAGRPEKPSAALGYVKVALLLASIAILWAAIAFHPAFLILLVVVVGPVSFALGRGQDNEWRRVGARRRYDTSGLAGFGEWNEKSVRARANELEALIVQAERGAAQNASEGRADEPEDAEALVARIADLNARVTAELADAGLAPEDTEGDTGEWLRLAARADGSRRALEEIKNERRRARDEAAELREQLGRYLSARGVKPTAHQDTSADIAERLDDLDESKGAGR